MTTAAVDLVVLHEHPEWQKPLFEALRRRGVSFAPFDLTRAAFSNDEAPRARLYFNQASPSAYLRGHTRAVPLALAYMRSLELLGARVLNGADVFALELSKSAQATLLRTLGIDTPRSITFNDPARSASSPATSDGPRCSSRTRAEAARASRWSNRSRRSTTIFRRDPSIWLPDNLFLLQEYLPHDPDQGIVRLEFLGGELLYAMRVKTHGRFNLCPSPVCNPDDGDSACALPGEAAVAAPPVEFSPFPDVPQDAVRHGEADRAGGRPRRRRDRVSRDPGRPARVLRHQRQLEPAAVRGRRVRLRSVRARRRLPGGGAADVEGVGSLGAELHPPPRALTGGS